MGELRKFYSLADVVFVGRTLIDLGSRQHGSDMIEPAALARPVIVGQFTGNFAEVMEQFRAAGAIQEVASRDELLEAIARALDDPRRATAMGQLAQDVVRRQQGATARNVAVILQHLK
jgi:3-deoxy-D-manno-octulosonic-acid transferase